MGFEPMTSVIPVQCSTRQLSYQTEFVIYPSEIVQNTSEDMQDHEVVCITVIINNVFIFFHRSSNIWSFIYLKKLNDLSLQTWLTINERSRSSEMFLHLTAIPQSILSLPNEWIKYLALTNPSTRFECVGINISSFSKWLDLSSSDANECNLGTDTCNKTSSRCVDTEGDFYCRCKDGFTQGINNKICDGT